MSSNTLFLYTNNYPYNLGEEFLENELFYLSKQFEKILIFTTNEGVKTKKLPNNTHAINIVYPSTKKKYTILIVNYFFILKQIITELVTSKNKRIAFFSIIKNATLIINQLYRIETIKKEISKHSNITYYSYWTNEWSILLAILKKKKKIKSFVSRIHGYDLYEERYPNKYIPFRHLQFSQSDAIVSISNTGKNYLTNKYKEHTNKFSICYLGVDNWGDNPLNNEAYFSLISCSRIDNNKRVLLLAQALKLIKFPLRWTHFGDGDLKPELQNIISTLPNQIHVTLKGHLAPHKIRKFYQNKPVDLFINVSKSEGLPVTLMEAISFRIPIMATNVGGVREIVNPTTGILLSANPTSTDIAEKLTYYYYSTLYKTIEHRLKIKDFWRKNFNAEINYKKFYNTFLKNDN